MYESYYGFKTKPFNTLPDPDFLYMSKKHEMALTYLEYGLSSQAGFMVLTGGIGSGKTTLINHLIKKTDERTKKTALIFNTNIKPLDFLENLLKEWDVVYKRKRKADLYEVLNSFLLKAYREKTEVILIIDEAQNLPFETLEEIRMISNLNDEKVPLLHIILSGQPNLIKRLNNPKLEQLLQRVSVHYHLEPLNKKETCLYIEHRVRKAQAAEQDIFLPDAVEKIYINSGGVPRVINLICDTALVYGYAEQKKPIDKSVIDLVVKDRKKMGLGFGGNFKLTGGIEPDRHGNNNSNRIAGLEKKYKQLNNNVYELALLVREMLRYENSVEATDQGHIHETELLHQKIQDLENKFSNSTYQKKINNFFKRWIQAEANNNKEDY